MNTLEINTMNNLVSFRVTQAVKNPSFEQAPFKYIHVELHDVNETNLYLVEQRIMETFDIQNHMQQYDRYELFDIQDGELVRIASSNLYGQIAKSWLTNFNMTEGNCSMTVKDNKTGKILAQ